MKEFEASKEAIQKSFGDTFKRISSPVDEQFDDLKENPIYENLIPILDIETCPEGENSLFDFGDICIEEITSSLELLLINKRKNENIPSQWGVLKRRVAK